MSPDYSSLSSAVTESWIGVNGDGEFLNQFLKFTCTAKFTIYHLHPVNDELLNDRKNTGKAN